MICFAAFTPHSPLLVEQIGKENVKFLQKTRESMQKLTEAFARTEPEVVFLISAHSFMHETAFSINLHDEYAIDFRDFGDHSTSAYFEPDLELISAIQLSARTSEIPFVLESFASLDYGSGVPLSFLSKKRTFKLVPISYCAADRKQHMAFGRILKDVAMQTHKRVAIIASGDLAHTLTTDAPMGYRKEGQQFDEAVQRSLEQFSASTLLNLQEKIVIQSEQCALRPLLILFGVLEKMQIKPKILSYEAPFGVGYLVAQFQLL